MNDFIKISLKSKIFLNITTLLIITICGAGVVFVYSYRMEGLLTKNIDKYIEGVQAAESMELALVNHKGFASYYFIDRNPDWLIQMAQYRRIFEDKFEKIRRFTKEAALQNALDRIESEYSKYISAKDRVINYYKSGNIEVGKQLHQQVRENFFEILNLCENFKNIFRQRARAVKNQSINKVRQLRIVVGSTVLAVIILAIILAFFLVHDILEPIRRLSLETDRHNGTPNEKDEVKMLSRHVHDLQRTYTETQSELEKSREHLLQSEKLALVGKLAAGTSHSIRNPLTSVKMRLFSLSRSLDLDSNQKEDFEVISKEISHIDTIVQNFLEFSRPPRLKLQSVSPSDVVDQAIQLLQHRLASYEVFIKIQRKEPLPSVQLDPEQLKEVMINIIINACEAMRQGGAIVIHEKTFANREKFKSAVIRISDNGPGIPETIQTKIMDPFFTTKEEGTGLGLSIAARIVQEHGGRLGVESREGNGSTFIITLPVEEPDREHHTDY